ncbi:hypothetical protein [Vibrio mimicus]|uniref:Uncharacterized protein n=1 Tax=Vibrio mimicus TaxID=674 RepID=A0A2J9VJR3_VIBMI|nr:hypothetical protein [Vibrio mimicus]KFE29541.1 hypothetical protein DN31_3748 [Vibrio mimicus]PNM63922.1 hypothetical protein AL544_003025 [Vibrio mimicus]
MDWKLFISVVAILISVGTFAFNAYYQMLRKAKLNVAIGDKSIFSVGKKNRLRLGVPLTFFNEGLDLRLSFQYGVFCIKRAVKLSLCE